MKQAYDPYSSDCSHFSEDSNFYGIEDHDGKLIMKHNRLEIH